jgi:hypothetical protein
MMATKLDDLCRLYKMSYTINQYNVHFWCFPGNTVYVVPRKYVYINKKGEWLIYFKQASEVITAVNLHRTFS